MHEAFLIIGTTSAIGGLYAVTVFAATYLIAQNQSNDPTGGLLASAAEHGVSVVVAFVLLGLFIYVMRKMFEWAQKDKNELKTSFDEMAKFQRETLLQLIKDNQESNSKITVATETSTAILKELRDEVATHNKEAHELFHKMGNRPCLTEGKTIG